MNAQGWWIATLGLTAVLWMPSVTDRFFKLGIARTLGPPGSSDADEQSRWAIRARRAHTNAVENLVVFAPLAAVAVHLGLGSSPIVSGACATYFFARLAHYALYAGGVPVARTLAFLIGIWSPGGAPRRGPASGPVAAVDA